MCQLRGSRGLPQEHMEDLRKRLTRSVSAPRRCSFCHKMVYFSTVRCKQCGNIMHKACSHSVTHRCNNSANGKTENGCNIIHPDPDVWHSADNTSEWWTNSTVSSCSFDEQHLHHSNPNAAMAGLLKFVHWLSHKRQSREINRNNPSVSEKHIKGRFGLKMKLDDKNARKRLKALLKNSQNHRTQVYVENCLLGNKVPETRTRNFTKCSDQYGELLKVENGHANSTLEKGSLRVQLPDYGPRRISPILAYRTTNCPEEESETWVCTHSSKRMHAAYDLKYTCSHKDSNLYSRTLAPLKEKCMACSGSAQSSRNRNRYPFKRNLGECTTGRPTRPPSISKAKTLSFESRDFVTENLCATWPPAGKIGGTLEEITDETEYMEESDQDLLARTESNNGDENLREWCIPFGDIEFQERIRHGRHGDIYRGRWYGEVLIYTLRQSSEKEMNQFLDEVAQMGMIRHENIVLFMGACMELPKLAVITSMRKGPSLFEYLHLMRHRLPFHSKLNIARQIAQGMGYLHAKDIAHKKLNSKNIILESRVKLCIMDHGMANKDYDRNDYGCIPRGHLSYISPELISSLQIDAPRIFPLQPYTQNSDIYAFGSLLFELLAERFAFHEQQPHAIIWQVATGKRCSLHNFRFINGFKTLIKKCWSQNPQQRPPFSQIVQELQENVSHHKRHSSSEPDRLHYTGQSMIRNICT